MNILILGVNGFIGSSLSEFVLQHRPDWHIYGMDIATNKIEACLKHPRFHFVEGDIRINREWVEYHIKKCDVVMPLVAIATPSAYINNPLEVFELAFEANLRIVRECVRYGKRVLFPSTSEVYGMCPDKEFDEENSNLVLGPINKLRWIYSSSKQLMDRVIYSYGLKENLQYTIFRPFNWIGPKLDNVWATKEGSSRVVSQFIGNVLRGEPINLVDGGRQRRNFLYIDDAVDALIRIIENKDGIANQRIFNIGSQVNDVSIKELAELLVEMIGQYPGYEAIAKKAQIKVVESADYYGKGYQDTSYRMPSIKNAEECLGWKPTTDLRTAIKKTLDYYLIDQAPRHPEAQGGDLSQTADEAA